MQNLLSQKTWPETPNVTDDAMIYGVDTSWELFDLTEDPHELTNVYFRDNYAAIRCHLTRTLLQLKHEARDVDQFGRERV